jgi:hypothetical protein
VPVKPPRLPERLRLLPRWRASRKSR